MPAPDAPLIVQSDLTLLLEVASPRYAEARDRILAFAELVKAPEHVHTYRITPLSIWNACATGLEPGEIARALEELSRYPVPDTVRSQVQDQAARFGRLVLEKGEHGLVLVVGGEALAEEIALNTTLRRYLPERLSTLEFHVDPEDRGRLKQALVKLGLPVRDLAGYTPGEALDVELRSTTRAGAALALRAYQVDAVDSFHARGEEHSGHGVVVLPCGSGKTIVGLAALSRVGASTLVLTTSTTAVRQWIAEILDKTSLTEEQVGEYTGHAKEIRPVTVATYQVLTHRTGGQGFTHLGLFDSRDWGLIVYDEVHLLPAPIFQITAGLQARRRLGLTATLVREDGHEDDVFALIGPKVADVPWKELENQGWIAKARCSEVRIPLPSEWRMEYAAAPERAKARVAAENPAKLAVVESLLADHRDDAVLVIGTYVDQLRELARAIDAPVMTGSTSQRVRDRHFARFRAGELSVLVVSKVANFAVDLPDASVAIQVSGSFGSRQEEAQRLGRLLRPKAGANQAHFYTLVSRDTKEQEFALRRQLFLCEQGYQYVIRDAEEVAAP